MRQLRFQVIGNLYAISAALAGDKDGKFKRFLDMLDTDTADVNKTIDEMKKAGLPIEEH